MFIAGIQLFLGLVVGAILLWLAIQLACFVWFFFFDGLGAVLWNLGPGRIRRKTI